MYKRIVGLCAKSIFLLMIFSGPAFGYALISDSNAKLNAFGGWGPHLRSIFTDLTGGLWYADEAMNANGVESIRYHKLVNNKWSSAGFNSVNSFGSIAQKAAHISNGEYIYSYGVDVGNDWLMECYYRTVSVYKGCNAMYSTSGLIKPDPSSNYIGAAITPSGTRVIWWSTAAAPYGKFFYTYNNGSGWVDPISTNIVFGGNNYRFVGYVRLVFNGNSHAEFVAETRVPGGQTCSSAGVCLAISGSFDLGGSVNFKLMPAVAGKNAIAGSDIWFNSADGSYHALAYDNTLGDTEYFYKANSAASWVHHYTYSGVAYARFATDGTSLSLVAASTSGTQEGIKVKSIALGSISGAINWGAVTTEYPARSSDGSMDDAAGIYVQGASYQTTPVDYHFGVVGRSPSHDHKVWHFKNE